MRRKIVSNRLTSCAVIKNGEAVRLGLINQAECAVSLELSFDQAQSILMTLPHLLTRALRARSGNEEARYVFPIGNWKLEVAADVKHVIATLTTTDGFEASFGIPIAMCQEMGVALESAGRAVTEAREAQVDAASLALARLN